MPQDVVVMAIASLHSGRQFFVAASDTLMDLLKYKKQRNFYVLNM
jgi:hypothetical protein